MPHQEFSLQTQDDLNLFAQAWTPTEPTQAAVCLVHGIGEHSGRYAYIAETFNSAGIGVLAFDLRGHGRSPGPRGHTPSYEHMLDDVARALASTQQRFPGVPTFLYGHSLGGNLVLNFALRRIPAITGVIATSPWIKLSFEPPSAQVKLAQILNRLMPSFSQANELDLQGLSRDPQVIQTYQQDPLVHNRITVRLFTEFFQAGNWALEHASDLALPLLLVHGSADRLTSPAASQDFAVRAGDLCTLKIWEGFYHETHNEPERDQVLAFTLEWIKGQNP